MAVAQTWTMVGVNDVAPTLALTTAEKQYDIIKPTGSGNPPDRVALMLSDVAWWFGFKTGGPYRPVAAGEAYPVILALGTTSIWVKTQSGTGTLYGGSPA